MNLLCDKNKLLDGLNLVGRAVSSRTTLSILECVLLTARHEGLILSANDMEISIDTAPIPSEVEVPGCVALNAKLLTDIVRKMPGDFVHIETDEKLMTLCKSGRARLNIPGLPGEDFPQVPESELVNAQDRYTLKAPLLKDMIRQTIFSVSQDPTKLALTGELFEIKDGALRLVAVDMFRISYRAALLSEPIQDTRAVVSGKALNELSRILPAESSAEENVTFYFTDKRAVFEAPAFTLISRLLTGDFIRYDQIFNDDFSTVVVTDRLLLLSSLERAILVAAESRMVPIKMEVVDDNLIITAQSERGQAYDEIPCETDGKDLAIHFNPRYFIESLRAITDEHILLKFNNALNPCTIRAIKENKEDDYKYLIVPLRTPS